VAGRAAIDLTRVGHGAASRLVIHGDFTAHNVLATGQPPTATGAIDFTLAHVEATLTDVGFALRRAGRPGQDAIGWDLNRIRALLTGYSRIQPLDPTAGRRDHRLPPRARHRAGRESLDPR